MSDKPGRFDDWQDVVDCHDCHHYWSDTCDGVPPQKKRNCQSFVATRNSDIPKRLSHLEDKVKSLTGVMLWLYGLTVIIVIGLKIGGVL